MAKMGHRLEAGPEDGERFMTTGDMREFLDRLGLLGDDGTTELRVKASVGSGKVLRVWATTEPRPLTASQDWDILRDDAPPALAGGDTVEIPASAITARPEPVGARHKRQ
jgi:hypothetical protein